MVPESVTSRIGTARTLRGATGTPTPAPAGTAGGKGGPPERVGGRGGLPCPSSDCTTATWGFDSCCFVCEPRNAGGLRIPFDHDTERDVVVATFTLDETFSGAPSYVHGGVSLAILDEAQAWATIALGGRFAVTTETAARFRRPVLVGATYAVEARLTGGTEERLTAAAEITDERGKTCVEAEATFAVLGPAQAARAVGAEDAIDPSFLRADGAERAEGPPR